jgi:hypothetical protein
MNAMIARLMQPSFTPETIVDLDAHIKIFLQCILHFQRHQMLNKDFLQLGNFISLLNYKDMVSEYGPLRL